MGFVLQKFFGLLAEILRGDVFFYDGKLAVIIAENTDAAVMKAYLAGAGGAAGHGAEHGIYSAAVGHGCYHRLGALGLFFKYGYEPGAHIVQRLKAAVVAGTEYVFGDFA